MTNLLQLPIEVINQAIQLDAAIQAMAGEPAIALDTESNSFHHYPEQLCLIQIATRYRIYIVDPITLKDICPLGEILENGAIRKMLHGADYDIRSLDRHSGSRIRNLYDTNIAARFAGLPRVGLAALIEDLLHITIPKSKRLQRADWGRRPLSAEALDYASADVRYLLLLQRMLDERLRALGRIAWVAEECARLEEVRYAPRDPETAYLSVKGARDVDGSNLAVLRSLFQFREQEALRQHRPPFFILPDAVLVAIAGNPAGDLAEVPGLFPVALRRYGRGISQALRDGLAAPPIFRPRVAVERPGEEQMERLRKLKAWRESLARELSLDPALLWPTASLERLAGAPDSLDAELESAEMRRWQRENFASSLRECLKSLR